MESVAQEGPRENRNLLEQSNANEEGDVEYNQELPESQGNVQGVTSEGTPVLSKRKQKRLARHEQWLKNKQQKKILRKEKKRKAKEMGVRFPSRSARRKKQKTMDCEEALPLKIVIDMAFDEFMDESSIKKLLKQVKTCYAVNRMSPNPIQLYLTSFGGQNKTVMEEIYHEYKNWDVHIKNEPYLDVFEKDEIVYLSSESENVLEDIDMAKTYIIGGLVDHNHHKGLCHKLAVEKQVSHAQLPIKDFVKLQSRTVLTVNHVFEIILQFLQTKNWQAAFDAVIPKRKGVSLLDSDNTGKQDEDNSNQGVSCRKQHDDNGNQGDDSGNQDNGSGNQDNGSVNQDNGSGNQDNNSGKQNDGNGKTSR